MCEQSERERANGRETERERERKSQRQTDRELCFYLFDSFTTSL